MNGFPSGIQKVYLSYGLIFDLLDRCAELCTAALMLEMLTIAQVRISKHLESFLFETPFKLPKGRSTH